MRLSVPEINALQIKGSIRSLLDSDSVTLRALSSVWGRINASTTIVRSIRYHCVQNFETIVLLEKHIRHDSQWWMTHLELLPTGPVNPPLPSMEVTTDSSLRGWGASSASRATGGAWDQTEKTMHINALELKAVLLAVQMLVSHCTSTTLIIRTDNTTAMHAINNFGSLRSPTLNTFARHACTAVISSRQRISQGY